MPPKTKAAPAKAKPGGKAPPPAAKGKASPKSKASPGAKAKASPPLGRSSPQEFGSTFIGDSDEASTAAETDAETLSPSPSGQITVEAPPEPPTSPAEEALKRTEEECQALKSQVSEMNEMMRIQVEEAQARTQKQCLEELAQMQKMAMKMEEEQQRRDLERDLDDSVSLKRLEEQWTSRQGQWQQKVSCLQNELSELRGRLAEREDTQLRQELETARHEMQKMREEKDSPTRLLIPMSEREKALQKQLEALQQDMASLKGSQQQQLQSAAELISSERERMLADQVHDVRQDIAQRERDLHSELLAVRQEMTKTKQDLESNENDNEKELLRQLDMVRRDIGRVTDDVQHNSMREAALQQELRKVREEMEKNVGEAAQNARAREEQVQRELEKVRLDASNTDTQQVSERETQLQEELREVHQDLERVANTAQQHGKEQEQALLLELDKVRREIGSSERQANEKQQQLEQELRSVRLEMERSVGEDAQRAKEREQALRLELEKVRNDAIRDALQKTSNREILLQQQLLSVQEDMERKLKATAEIGRQREETLRQELEQIQKGMTQATSNALQDVKDRELSLQQQLQQVLASQEHEDKGSMSESIQQQLSDVRRDMERITKDVANQRSDREIELHQQLEQVQLQVDKAQSDAALQASEQEQALNHELNMVRSDAAQHLSAMHKMETSQQPALQNPEQMLWRKFEAMHEDATERAAERENLLEAQLSELRSEMGTANAAKATWDQKKERPISSSGRSRSPISKSVILQPSDSPTSHKLQTRPSSRGLRKAQTENQLSVTPGDEADGDDKGCSKSEPLQLPVWASSELTDVGVGSYSPDLSQSKLAKTSTRMTAVLAMSPRSKSPAGHEDGTRPSRLLLPDAGASPRGQRTSESSASPTAGSPSRSYQTTAQTSKRARLGVDMKKLGSTDSIGADMKRGSTDSIGDQELGRNPEKDSERSRDRDGRHSAKADSPGPTRIPEPLARDRSTSASSARKISDDVDAVRSRGSSPKASGASRGFQRSVTHATDFGGRDLDTGAREPPEKTTRKAGDMYLPPSLMRSSKGDESYHAKHLPDNRPMPSGSDGEALPVLWDKLSHSLNVMENSVSEARVRLDGTPSSERSQMDTMTAARVHSGQDEDFLMRSVDQMQKAVDLVLSHQLHTESHVMNDFCFVPDAEDEATEIEKINADEDEQLAALLNPARDRSLWCAPAQWSVPRTLLAESPHLLPLEAAAVISAAAQDQQWGDCIRMNPAGVCALPPSLWGGVWEDWAAPPHSKRLSPMVSPPSAASPGVPSSLDQDKTGNFQNWNEPFIPSNRPAPLSSSSPAYSHGMDSETFRGNLHSVSPAESPGANLQLQSDSFARGSGACASGIHTASNLGSRVESHLLVPSSPSPGGANITAKETLERPAESTPATHNFHERCKGLFAKCKDEMSRVKDVQKKNCRAELEETLRSLRGLTTEMGEASTSFLHVCRNKSDK